MLSSDPILHSQQEEDSSYSAISTDVRLWFTDLSQRFRERVFIATVSSKIVTPSVGSLTYGADEAAGEVNVVVVPNVGHYFAAETAAVKVRTAR